MFVLADCTLRWVQGHSSTTFVRCNFYGGVSGSADPHICVPRCGGAVVVPHISRTISHPFASVTEIVPQLLSNDYEASAPGDSVVKSTCFLFTPFTVCIDWWHHATLAQNARKLSTTWIVPQRFVDNKFHFMFRLESIPLSVVVIYACSIITLLLSTSYWSIRCLRRVLSVNLGIG